MGVKVEETTQCFNVVIVEAGQWLNNSSGGNQSNISYGGPPEYLRRFLLFTLSISVVAALLQVIPVAISRGLPADTSAPNLLLAQALVEIIKRIEILKFTLCGVFGKLTI